MEGEMHNSLQLSHARDRDFAMQEALRLASARDDLSSKYLFGLATFNAASVVALLTSLTGVSNVTAFGLDSASLKASLAFFITGVVCARISISATQNNFIVRAGFTAARVIALSTLIDLSASNRADDGQYERVAEDRDRLFRDSLKVSIIGTVSQNLSSGAWLIGALIPLAKALGTFS